MPCSPAAARRALWLLALTGCAPPPPVELAALDGVRPATVGAGATVLVVSGDGFPVGRDATFRFDGRVRAAGAEPRPLAHAWPARVRTETEAVVALPHVGAAGRRAYAGRARLEFAPRDGEGAEGRALATPWTPVAFVEGADPPAARGIALDEAARRDAAGLGLTLAERSGAVHVAAVEPGSAAARAGVEAGDVLVAVEGLPVAARADLAGGGDGPLRLALERRGQPREVTLRTAAAAHVRARPPLELGAWAAFAWLAALALAARPGQRRPAAPPHPVAACAAALGIALVPALVAVGPAGLSFLALWAAFVAGRALTAPGLRLAPPALAVVAARAAVATAPLGGALLGLGATTGAWTLGAWMDASPAGALAPPAVLLLPALAYAVDRPGPGAAAAAFRGLGAGTAAAAVAGGWTLAPGLLGHAVYAVVALGLYATLDRLLRRGVPAWLAWIAAASLPLASRAWSTHAHALPAAPTSAALLASACAVALAALLARYRARPGDAALHPL